MTAFHSFKLDNSELLNAELVLDLFLSPILGKDEAVGGCGCAGAWCHDFRRDALGPHR